MATDADALNELMQVSDVTTPHVVMHYLYFPTEQAANEAGRKLRVLGFDVNDALGKIFGSWALTATSEIVPTLAQISELRMRLSALASEVGGEYDGWEAEVPGSED